MNAVLRALGLRSGPGLWPPIAIAASLCLSALVAALTAWNCNTTDGTFKLTDPYARPSGYCRWSGMRSGPDAGELIRDVAIYAAPALVLLLGWRLAVARERASIFYASAALAIAITIAQLVLFTEANVGYAGQG